MLKCRHAVLLVGQAAEWSSQTRRVVNLGVYGFFLKIELKSQWHVAVMVTNITHPPANTKRCPVSQFPFSKLFTAEIMKNKLSTVNARENARNVIKMNQKAFITGELHRDFEFYPTQKTNMSF